MREEPPEDALSWNLNSPATKLKQSVVTFGLHLHHFPCGARQSLVQKDQLHSYLGFLLNLESAF
jgi:hypothetical protein